ncbi:MAG: hypothetical protein FWD41_01265 [Actinomycetia bacterium]|nr:hypothetical protein [Actinomycetes bacterium]
MSTRTSKFLFVLVAALLVLGVVPALASAATLPVNNWATFTAALNTAVTGDVIQFTSTISTTNNLIYNAGEDIEVDLNGYNLNITAMSGDAISVGFDSALRFYGGNVNIAVMSATGKGVVVTDESVFTTASNIAGGAWASDDSIIEANNIAGGAHVESGGKITVLGNVDSIWIEGVNVPLSDYMDPPTCDVYKEGFFTYTDGTSIVWVAGEGAPDFVHKVLYVTVTPAVVHVQQGASQQFSADVVCPCGGVSQDVTWSVTGSTNPNTYIDASGLLHVAIDETATDLVVTATSVYDPDVSGSAEVVVDKLPGPGPDPKPDPKPVPPTGDASALASSLGLVSLALANLAAYVVNTKKRDLR